MEVEPEAGTVAPATPQAMKVDLCGIQRAAALKAAASDPEFIRKSRLAFSESFGAAAWLLSHDPAYRSVAMQNLESIVGAPLRLGQFKVYRKEGVPFAYASWAMLAPDVAARARHAADLQAEEWKSGSDIYVVDLVAPFGGRDLVEDEIGKRLYAGAPLRMLRNGKQADVVNAELPRGIRPGVEADIPHLVALGRSMHAESTYAALGFDDLKVTALLHRYIRNPESHCLLVAEHDGRLVGALCGYITEQYFGPDRVATDQAVFIHPEARGGMAAARLVKAFIAWAESRQVRNIRIGVSSGVETGRTGRLLEVLGFENAGGNYLYRTPL